MKNRQRSETRIITRAEIKLLRKYPRISHGKSLGAITKGDIKLHRKFGIALQCKSCEHYWDLDLAPGGIIRKLIWKCPDGCKGGYRVEIYNKTP